jgi:hypothetical protein
MKYYVGYYRDSYADAGKPKKFIVKATASNKEQADELNKQLSAKLNLFEFNQDKRFMGPNAKPSTALRYEVLSENQLKNVDDKRKSKVKEVAAEKRKKTLAKKSPEERKKVYILCPKCRAHSKLLYSEMGGLQHRRCKNGHEFQYDKWVSDRLGSILIFGNPLNAAKFMAENPVEIK